MFRGLKFEMSWPSLSNLENQIWTKMRVRRKKENKMFLLIYYTVFFFLQKIYLLRLIIGDGCPDDN
jgi:hypothetical protein